MAKNKYKYHNANDNNNRAGDERRGEVDEDAVDIKNDSEGCCSISCLNFSLHLFNALFLLSGAVIVAGGVRILVETHPSLASVNSQLYDINAYVSLCAGGIIILTSLYGCVALCRGSPTLLLVYAVLVAAIFLIEAGAGILCYAYRDKIGTYLERTLAHKFSTEYGVNAETTQAIDSLQTSLECCGVHAFEDWRDSEWWNLSQREFNKVPDSCCITPSKYCGVRDHPSNIRYTGCVDRIEKLARSSLLIVGATAIAICLVQLLGTILAFLLYCRVKKRTRYG